MWTEFATFSSNARSHEQFADGLLRMSQRKKILFVTHALESLYGAATSLRLLLENYSGIDADLLLPRSFRHPRDLAATATRFACVRRAYEISMPVDLGLLGIRRGLADTAHGAAHWLGWQRDRVLYRRILRNGSYDIVHFNSPALHHMLLPGLPAVTHMRDIIIDSRSPVIDKLAGGRGIVFIDAATRQPFTRRENSMHAITLNNPIDMREGSQRLRHPLINQAATVFSMIGRVSELKGVHLVIEAFRLGAGADAVLVIVGAGSGDYTARCRAAASGDPRILFWGEEENIDSVYAVTDYVVRGDPAPCVGRTVYEGLYSGCRVIMPGPGQPDLIFEAARFQDAIFFYGAGQKNELSAVFSARTGKKIQARQYQSNISDYVMAFDAFIASCIPGNTSARP